MGEMVRRRVRKDWQMRDFRGRFMPEGKTEWVKFRLKPEELRTIREFSEERECSMSALIRAAVKKFIAEGRDAMVT